MMRRPAFLSATTLCSLAVLLILAPQAARGQAAWEYSPYEVRIWLAAPPQSQLPPALRDRVLAELNRRADLVFAAAWSARAEPAPSSVAGALADRLEVPFDELKTAAADVFNSDKLIVVRPQWQSAAGGQAGGWQVAARELDVRSRQWSEIVTRTAAGGDALPLAAWDAVSAVFTPLARIESVDGAQIKARLRAGGLILDPASPALAEQGMVLRPITRRNDRTGQPAAKGGIQPLPWTLLTIEDRDDALLSCKLHSGFRSSIPARGGARVERLALLVRPQFPATKLALKSRSTEPRPLSGYEVFLKKADGGESPLLGVTDWQGEIELPRRDGSLQVLVVRNGSQLLARLPLVPGQQAVLEAPLIDDDGRLQAEGAVAALESMALDLAARREIVAARFRTRLKEQKFEEAQQLLDEFRKLDSRTSLGRILDEQQQQVKAGDRLTQQRIDKLFGDARQLLTVKSLADDMINVLAGELTKARSAPRSASATNPVSAGKGS
jgi:hypothetical protein